MIRKIRNSFHANIEIITKQPNKSRENYMKMPIVLIFMLLFLAMGGCANSRDYHNEKDFATHHTTDGFRNPYLQEKKRGFLKYLKMRYFSGEKFADNTDAEEKIPAISAVRLYQRFHSESQKMPQPCVTYRPLPVGLW